MPPPMSAPPHPASAPPLTWEDGQDAEELACFERAETVFAERGDLRGAGEHLFWQGCYRQVLADDDQTARPLFERALELSQQAGDALTSSYSLRHLGISRHMAKDLDAAERLLEESTSLRPHVT